MLSRRTIGLVLLISFVAIAVFGFAAMGDGHGHTHSGCIAATASGVRSCQDSRPSNAGLLFHIQTFKSFSQALTVGVAALAFFSLVVVLLGVVSLGGTSLRFQNSKFIMPGSFRGAQLWQRTRRRIMHWLALHESRADHACTGA